MKLNVLVPIVAVCSLFFSMSSMALSEMSPYQGVVPANNSTEAQLQEKALEQVFIKVSGNADINKLEGSNALDSQLNSIMSEFGYKTVGNKSYYYADFDKANIDDAIRAMKQPIWSDGRPEVLIWLLNENKKLTSESMIDGELSSGLLEGELTRGISTQFPLMDLDDALAISEADVGGRFYQTMGQAANRYGTNTYVAANLTNLGNEQWELKWDLVEYTAANKKSEVILKQVSNGNKKAVMSAMIGEIADYYADKFAVLETTGEKTTQTITIKNITSFQDIIKINALLENLNAVESFEVVNMTETEVELLISLKGGIKSLTNALNSHSKLQQNLITPSPFDYNWQP